MTIMNKQLGFVQMFATPLRSAVTGIDRTLARRCPRLCHSRSLSRGLHRSERGHKPIVAMPGEAGKLAGFVDEKSISALPDPSPLGEVGQGLVDGFTGRSNQR